MTAKHEDLMDAVAYWRQFVVSYYFEKPQDRISGWLVDYWTDGPLKDPVPRIRLRTNDGRQFDIVAHQERLKALLVKAAPIKGDTVTIVYIGEAEKAAPGMSKSKLFTVEVTRPGSQSQARTESQTGKGSENEPGTGIKAT